MLTIRDGIINYGLIAQLDDVYVSIILTAIYFYTNKTNAEIMAIREQYCLLIIVKRWKKAVEKAVWWNRKLEKGDS